MDRFQDSPPLDQWEGRICSFSYYANLPLTAPHAPQRKPTYYTTHGKVLEANLLQKIFSDRVFYVTITGADIVSLKYLHTLFDKYLNQMLLKFEQNHMIRTIQNFELFVKKWLTIFEKVLTLFWKRFQWHKQLFDAKILI